MYDSISSISTHLFVLVQEKWATQPIEQESEGVRKPMQNRYDGSKGYGAQTAQTNPAVIIMFDHGMAAENYFEKEPSV